MTKEEKKNVIIAVVLCIAAVFILWLLSRGDVTPGTVAGNDLVIPSDNPFTAPNYLSYNLPAYNSPNIPGVGGSTVGGITNVNGDGCCCDKCGPPGSLQDLTVNFYQQFLGG